MTDAAKAMSAIRRIDDLSRQNTVLSRLHPLSHLIVTLVFVISVLSLDRYSPAMLTAFMVYLVITPILANIPFGVIIKRSLVALPAAALLGMFNPIFDQTRISIGGVEFSVGWISLFTLILKCVITVFAALILICITGIEGICASLRAVKLPNLIVSQLSFTYRYIHVLGEEIVHVLTAYRLRAPHSRGVSLAQFGTLCGGLFLRSLKRAEAIYAAMRCRGWGGAFPFAQEQRASAADCGYILIWSLFFIFASRFNIPEALGNFLLGS